MAPPLGLGLAGCGNFGTFCLAAAADLADTAVVAVTDVEPHRATALAATYGAHAVPDLDALLADPAVDVVMVATPSVAHGPMAFSAALAGKRRATRRLRVRATLGGEAAKVAVYRESVRAGLADLGRFGADWAPAKSLRQ